MPENHSRVGKSVEKVKINDDVHEKYRNHDPWTGERLKTGIPILSSVASGKVVEKEITYSNVLCPNCKSDIYFDNEEEPVCQSCGIICNGQESNKVDRMIRDAKAAGRTAGSGSENSV
jgi:hypothetical protein